MSSGSIGKFCLETSKKCLCLGTSFSTPHSIRFLNNKHWHPKWKKFRALKTIPIELPDYQKETKDTDEMTPDEIRSYYKELGIRPVRPWYERKFNYQSTVGIFEAYIPPEGDGKVSGLNKAGRVQKLEWLKQKTKSWKDLRKIRTFDEDFELYPDFVDLAEDVYKKAHECLATPQSRSDKLRETLLQHVTEKAYTEMLFNRESKTIRWNFLKSLEPPRVCHVRTFNMVEKDNLFAQITLRFHSQQTLVIYDRFGRNMYGSESIAKDVLEYVVFEKHMTSQYGSWRLHGKIIPDWLPARDTSPRTHILPKELDEYEETPTQIESVADVAVPTIQVAPQHI